MNVHTYVCIYILMYVCTYIPCMHVYVSIYLSIYIPVRTHDNVVAIDFDADGLVKVVELVVELNARPKEHIRNEQGTHSHT